MNRKKYIVTYMIALVWVINGLFCKLLNLEPRHELIISSILGENNSSILTLIIGFFEVLIACWILSGYKSKISAVTQIIIVLTMNLIEFSLTPDLLLWGKLNIVFAFLFTVLVYYNAFFIDRLKLCHDSIN